MHVHLLLAALVILAGPRLLEATDRDLRQDVEVELEGAGIDLSVAGLRLEIVPETEVLWTVLLTHELPPCSARRRVGDLPGERAELASRLALIVSQMHAQIASSETCLSALRWTPERRKALEQAVDGAITRNLIEPLTFGIYDALLGSTMVWVAGFSEDEESDRRGFFVFGAALGAGGYTSLALSKHDYGGTVATGTFLAAASTLLFAGTYAGEHTSEDGKVILPDRRHDGPLIAGISTSATLATLLVERIRRRPVSGWRLLAHSQKLEGPISAAELDRIERDLIRAQSSPHSGLLIATPLLLGSAALTMRGLAENHRGEAKLDYLLAGSAGGQGAGQEVV